MKPTFVVAGPALRGAAYRVRQEAYAEIGFAGTRGGGIADAFDPISIVFVALVDGDAVGTIRITPPGDELRWGIEEEFPTAIAGVRRIYARRGQTLWESSRVMILPAFQKRPHLLVGLVGCLHRFGRDHGIDGYVWGCTPEHGRMYEAFGALRVAGPKAHSTLPTQAVAMHWQLVETAPRFARVFESLDITIADDLGSAPVGRSFDAPLLTPSGRSRADSAMALKSAATDGDRYHVDG